jgi:hypothetical protein
MEVIGGQKGVQHMRYGNDATPEQKAMMVMAGGYANDSISDVQGYDAARQACIDAGEDAPKTMMERMAAGYMAHEGKSFKQTTRAKERFQRAMFKQALLGSEAYVSGESGNAYTEFLRTRYGDMSSDQQAWGVHMFTDPTSPESGWSPKVGPATETLFNAGIPINAGYRAAAANPAVLKSAAWARGPAIRGVAAYVDAQATKMCGPTTPQGVRDALIGRIAPNVDAAEVSACTAIMQEATNVDEGERSIRANPVMVKSIAQLVAGGHAKDAISAYRSLKSVSNTMANRQTVSSQNFEVMPNSNGGGSAGSMPPPPPPPQLTGGAEHIVEATYSNPGTSNSAASNIAGGAIQAASHGVQPVQRHVNMNFDPRGSMHSVRGHVDAIVSGHIIGQDVHVHGGANPTSQNVDVDVRASHAGQTLPPPRLPGNVAMPNSQVKRDVNVNIQSGGAGPNTTERLSTQLSAGPPTASDQITIRGANGASGGAGNQITHIDTTAQSNSRPAGMTAQQAASIASNDLNRAGHSLHNAQQFIIDMHAAGFKDEQIQDPRIVQAAMDIWESNDSQLPLAAIAATKLGPNDFNKGAVQVFDLMVEAGWDPGKISRPDFITGSAIIASGGGYPTQDYVRDVRKMPDFSPTLGPNKELPKIPYSMVQQYVAGEDPRTKQPKLDSMGNPVGRDGIARQWPF